jgi:hypothetical protein
MNKVKQYYIDENTGNNVIKWGLQNRPEGMKGAGDATMAQLRFVLKELLEIATKQEKVCPPTIQRDFENDNQN